MSYYETPEERRIREQRAAISSMESRLNSMSRENQNLQNQLSNARRQQQLENQELQRRMEQQLAERDRQNRQQMSQTVQALDAQMKERERLQNQRITALQQSHNNQINQLNTRMEQERAGLRTEMAQTRQEMHTRINNLRQETDRQLQAQRVETQNSINRLRNDMSGQISAVDSKVQSLANQIQAQQNGQKELAQYWVQETQRLLTQIEENDVHHLMNTNQLRRALSGAQQDVEVGNYQSAIATGRTAFYNAMDMKEDLAAAEMEWSLWYNSLRSRQTQLLENLNSADHRAYRVAVDGEDTEYNDLNYWTYGQLDLLRGRIDQQCSQLEDAEHMNVQQMQEAEAALRGLQEELDLLENAGENNVAMMVSRYDTAVRIGSFLGDEYQMVDADGDFFGEENREEYHAIFENTVTGSRAVVVITPLPDEHGVVTNHVEVIVDDGTNNAVSRDQMVESIRSDLYRKTGEQYSFPCSQRYGDRTAEEADRVGDIEAVREGKTGARAAKPVRDQNGNVQHQQVTRVSKSNG